MPKVMKRRKKRRPTGDGPNRKCKHLDGVYEIDYKDHELLRKFMTEKGKIMPGRSSYANAKQQRQIKRAIRRARVMGLLP